MRNILQPLRPPTTHVTLVQQTIADISKYSSNHLFIVILNETLWLWLFSSCFCFVHLGSHFAHLLWFCPKLGLCWFRWMPSGEICMHKGGQWRGFFCTALLVVLVYYRSAHMQCASISWMEREGLSQDDTILNAMDLDSGLLILFCFAVSRNIYFKIPLCSSIARCMAQAFVGREEFLR